MLDKLSSGKYLKTQSKEAIVSAIFQDDPDLETPNAGNQTSRGKSDAIVHVCSCPRSELGSCVKVDVAVLGSQSLIDNISLRISSHIEVALGSWETPVMFMVCKSCVPVYAHRSVRTAKRYAIYMCVCVCVYNKLTCICLF